MKMAEADGAKILIVEDDRNLLDTLKYNFSQEGYAVLAVSDGAEAVEIARREKPDIIILDLMLPGISGLDICRILRKETNVPILMLTAKAEEIDRIVGLEIGADDYVTKPFSLRELLARVRAMLRRMQMSVPVAREAEISFGNIHIDIARHRITKDGAPLELTPKEYDLLIFLAENKTIVFSRDQLLEKVWGYDFPGDTRTVDVHVRWLRQKIEPVPEHPVHIITVRGTGYKLEG